MLRSVVTAAATRRAHRGSEGPAAAADPTSCRPSRGPMPPGALRCALCRASRPGRVERHGLAHSWAEKKRFSKPRRIPPPRARSRRFPSMNASVHHLAATRRPLEQQRRAASRCEVKRGDGRHDELTPWTVAARLIGGRTGRPHWPTHALPVPARPDATAVRFDVRLPHSQTEKKRFSEPPSIAAAGLVRAFPKHRCTTSQPVAHTRTSSSAASGSPAGVPAVGSSG
jgi:hypothetical protein